MIDGDTSGAGLVRALLRWQEAGAAWTVLERGPARVTVALLRCDGGEEVERLTSGDPSWLTFLDGRSSSDDL